MKKTSLIAVVGFGMVLASQAALAGSRHAYHDSARVLKVKPIYETVRVNRPRRKCWDEPVYHRGHSRSAVPTITGAVIGGVIGNQFGKGGGRDALTIAGTLLGGAIGHDIGERRAGPGYETMERRCRTVDRFSERDEVVGYRVKYRYNGKNHWTRSDRHPGKYIRVKVKVRPEGRNDHGYYYDDDRWGFGQYPGRRSGYERF
jgi:uncharacterized protein YcfJ